MKKLIALTFCLTVMAVAARADFPKQAPENAGALERAVSQQVDKAERVVHLRVHSAADPRSAAEGKAVIMGVDQQGNVVLLTSQPLATDIDILGDEHFLGKIVEDKKSVSVSRILNIQSVNPGVNQHHYKITMKSSFRNLKMLTVQQAVALLK